MRGSGAILVRNLIHFDEMNLTLVVGIPSETIIRGSFFSLSSTGLTSIPEDFGRHASPLISFIT